eukprot:2282184-Pyramimonas_sp.AAC.1
MFVTLLVSHKITYTRYLLTRGRRARRTAQHICIPLDVELQRASSRPQGATFIDVLALRDFLRIQVACIMGSSSRSSGATSDKVVFDDVLEHYVEL